MYGAAAARPETSYAKSGDVHIAYQVFGEGDVDVVMVNGYTTHVELVWEHEPIARALEGPAPSRESSTSTAGARVSQTPSQSPRRSRSAWMMFAR